MNLDELMAHEARLGHILFILGIPVVSILASSIGGGFASNYLYDDKLEVEQQVEQQYAVVQNNQLPGIIEKERLIEESEIEEERKQLIKIGAELHIVFEEVEELEAQLKDFPADGSEIEYSELYAYYGLKWNEYNSMYDQYDKRVEKFNITVESYNTKYGLTK